MAAHMDAPCSLRDLPRPRQIDEPLPARGLARSPERSRHLAADPAHRHRLPQGRALLRRPVERDDRDLPHPQQPGEHLTRPGDLVGPATGRTAASMPERQPAHRACEHRRARGDRAGRRAGPDSHGAHQHGPGRHRPASAATRTPPAPPERPGRPRLSPGAGTASPAAPPASTAASPTHTHVIPASVSSPDQRLNAGYPGPRRASPDSSHTSADTALTRPSSAPERSMAISETYLPATTRPAPHVHQRVQGGGRLRVQGVPA